MYYWPYPRLPNGCKSHASQLWDFFNIDAQVNFLVQKSCEVFFQDNASTMQSKPSVNAAGPGCRIRGDLISTIRPFWMAGIVFHPGRAAIFSGRTFFPHHDARITSGAAEITSLDVTNRSFAAA